MLGTLGLGVSSEDAPQKQEAGSTGVTRVLRLGLCFLVLGALILYGSRMTSPVRRKAPGGSGAAASIHGLQVILADFEACAMCLLQTSLFIHSMIDDDMLPSDGAQDLQLQLQIKAIPIIKRWWLFAAVDVWWSYASRRHVRNR